MCPLATEVASGTGFWHLVQFSKSGARSAGFRPGVGVGFQRVTAFPDLSEPGFCEEASRFVWIRPTRGRGRRLRRAQQAGSGASRGRWADREWYVAGTVAVKLSAVAVSAAGELFEALRASGLHQERAPMWGEIAVDSGAAAWPAVAPACRPR